MSARPTLKLALAQPAFSFALPTPAVPALLARARLRIERQLGSVVVRAPSPYDLHETYLALRAEQLRKGNCSSLHRRHLRRSPWVLFHSLEDDRESMVTDQLFLDQYLGTLAGQGSDSAVGALAHVFLREYPRGQPCFVALRRTLRNELAKRESPRLKRFRARSQQFSLFEDDGPTRFAQLFQDAPDADALLDDAGLDGELANTGFIVYTAEAWLDAIRRTLAKQDSVQRTLDDYIDRILSFFTQGDDSTKLRFPSLRIALAESLLLPFESTFAPDLVRPRLERFFLESYGDPRIGQGQWHGVSERARNVLMRWLVDATLEDFFRIVSHSSKHDPDADRMWPYRKSFWRAYLNKGVISDAWVVLGSQVRAKAHNMLSRMEAGSYGVLLSGSGAQPSHAVLILRIADVVITEWSHSGKYRLWHAENDSAPPLYGPRYTRSRLIRSPDHEGIHSGAASGTWQRRLAKEIERRTSIMLNAREYMPSA